MRAAPYIRSFWRTLNTPDSFARNPEGAALNQIGHTFLGVWSVQFYCDHYFLIYSEMPFRAPLASFLVIAYLIGIETLAQGLKRRVMAQPFALWDSALDGLFFTFGVLAGLAPFFEIDARDGVSVLERRPWVALGISYAWLAIFVPYVGVRIWRASDAN